MVSIAISAFLTNQGIPPDRLVVTAVLPGGCPAACAFCFVAQRDERSMRSQSALKPFTLPRLLRALDEQDRLGGAAIVGDEPLHDAAWPYTLAFLESGHSLGTPLAMITNAFELERYTSELKRFSGIKITVSLDGIGKRHDRIRRAPGAFEKIARGLRAVTKHETLRKGLSIATILLPKHLDYIHEVIEFGGRLGIGRVILSPLLSTSRTAPTRAHFKTLQQATGRIPAWLAAAERSKVELVLSDELVALGEWETLIQDTGIAIIAPRHHPNLIRVDATGRIETYDAIRHGYSTGLSLDSDGAGARRLVKRLTMQPPTTIREIA